MTLDKAIEELIRLRRKIDGMRGTDGVTVGHGNHEMTISLAAQPKRQRTTSSTISDPYRQLLNIQANDPVGGVYQGTLVQYATLPVSSGASVFTIDDIYAGTGGTVKVVNLNEMGQTTHLITAAPQTLRLTWGWLVPELAQVFNAGLNNVYLINGIDLAAC